REQHEREQLWKEDEVRLVIACYINKISNLPDKFVEVLHGSGLQLASRDTDALHPARNAELGTLLLVHEWVAPDHVHGEGARMLVLRQVVFEDADRLEPIGELKAE